MASHLEYSQNGPGPEAREALDSPLVGDVLKKICEELRDQKYQIGDKLPTFRSWSKRYQVSLYATRRALLHLKNMGIISSREGSYTFLARKPEAHVAVPLAEKPKARTTIQVCFQEPKNFRKIQLSLLHKQFRKRFLAAHAECEVTVEYIPTDMFLRTVHDWQDHQGASFAQFTTTHLDFLSEHQLNWPVAPSELHSPLREEFAAYCDRLLPKVQEACIRPSAGNSHEPCYGLIPRAVTIPLLTHFRPIFQECGLPRDRAPADWGELYDYCRRIKKQLGLVPLHFGGYPALIWWYFHLEAQAAPFRPNQSTETIFRPGASGLQAMEFLCKLASEKLLEIHADNGTAFHSKCLSGKVPMLISMDDSPSQFFHMGDAEPFVLSRLPAGPNGRITGLFNVGGHAIRSSLTLPEKNAAVQYLLGWMSYLSSKLQTKFFKLRGVTPSIIYPWKDEPVHREIPVSWQDALVGALENSLQEPQNADLQKQSLAPFFQTHFRPDEAMPSPEELLHSVCLHLSEDGLW